MAQQTPQPLLSGHPHRIPGPVSQPPSPKGSKNKDQSFLCSVRGSAAAKQEPGSTRAPSHHHTPAPAHPADPPTPLRSSPPGQSAPPTPDRQRGTANSCPLPPCGGAGLSPPPGGTEGDHGGGGERRGCHPPLRPEPPSMTGRPHLRAAQNSASTYLPLPAPRPGACSPHRAALRARLRRRLHARPPARPSGQPLGSARGLRDGDRWRGAARE